MSKSDRNFLEMIMEGGEAFIDLLVTNEAVKAVPVVGSAIKFCKGVDDLRSKYLMAKIQKFISDPSLRSSVDKKLHSSTEWIEKNEAQLGETIFMVLEKFTDFRKPIMLARVFAFYLDGKMEKDEFLLAAHALDQGYLGDIEKLCATAQDNVEDIAWKQRLQSVGLTIGRTVAGPTGGDPTMNFLFAPLATSMREAINAAPLHIKA